MLTNFFWKIVGGLLLPLNALRHGLFGYTRARDLPAGQIAKAIAYDWGVVERWRKALGNGVDLRGKTILELGPGPDLGVGLVLLALGAKSYTAVDRHPLAATTPKQFYDELIATIRSKIPDTDEKQLGQEIEKLMAGFKTPFRHSGLTRIGRNGNLSDSGQARMTDSEKNSSNLQYICRDDFSFADIPNRSIDVIVSNAAFEHFDDIADVIKRVSMVAKPGARFVADIDLQTHSRIVRAHDPLNIYRFRNGWYALGKFVGAPNRVRPQAYQKALESNGWIDIVIEPLAKLDEQKTHNALPFLAPQFRSPAQQMHYLDIMITATIPSL